MRNGPLIDLQRLTDRQIGTPYVRPSYDLAGTPGPPYSVDSTGYGPWGRDSLAYPTYGEDELDRVRYERLRQFERQLMAMDGLEEEERLRRWNMRVRWERLEAEDRIRRWDLMHEVRPSSLLLVVGVES